MFHAIGLTVRERLTIGQTECTVPGHREGDVVVAVDEAGWSYVGEMVVWLDVDDEASWLDVVDVLGLSDKVEIVG